MKINHVDFLTTSAEPDIYFSNSFSEYLLSIKICLNN